ncbi:hypothetical protein D3C85_1336210 [compost metagenome]
MTIQSCNNSENETKLNDETISELQGIVGSKNISFTKQEKKYTLTVNNSSNKTEIGKEMSASVASIILYNEVVKNNPSIFTETKLTIDYPDSNKKFSFKLEEVSDAIKAEEVIDSTLTDLKRKKIKLEDFSCPNNISHKKLEDWSKINNYLFGGFELLNESFCSVNRNVIVWMVFINPQNKQLWFYIDKRDYKLLNIIEK